MIVVDANIVIYLVYETSFSPLARQVHAMDPDWAVPELWEAEVLNGLMNELRAGHTRLDDAIRAAGNAALLMAGKSHRCDRAAVLRTAHEARLTAYDACYVALARGLGAKLVTEDGRILRHCKDVARSLKAFLRLPEKPAAVRERSVEYRTRRKA
jgi:predicted nucleic acid-binding protein